MSNTITRAFSILEVVAAGRVGLHFSGIAEQCPDIASATLARTLKFLLQEGYLAKGPDGAYGIGPASVSMAQHLLSGAVPRERLVRPFVNRLAEGTGESAAYYEMDRDKLIIIAKKEMPESFHYLSEGARTGRLHHHLFSQAVFAFSGRESVNRIKEVEGLSCSETETLSARLKQVREQGAACGPENTDVSISRIVAPVFSTAREPVGSVGITVLSTDIPADIMSQFRKDVFSIAKELSEKFKHNNIL